MADLITCLPLTRDSILAAHEVIKSHIHLTPLLTNTTMNILASTRRKGPSQPSSPTIRLYLKAENVQRIGAFKIRGAFHAISRLLQHEPSFSPTAGVATHSSGNHAQALALAAKEHGMPAHVVMPSISPPNKIAATKEYGAHVWFSGSTGAEREAVVEKVVQETGARLVPPYDHPDIILGQGTVGLEMQKQTEGLLPKAKRHLDAIIAPCGGGGLLSGIALSCEGTGIRVFGAEPSLDGADDGRRGYYSGERVTAVTTQTIADGLRTSVGVHPWSVIYERRLVAGMYSVSEDEIRAAMRLVFERMKMVVEPSAVVGLAVVLYNEGFRSMVVDEADEEGWDIGVVLSGGNVSLDALGDLLGKGEVKGAKDVPPVEKKHIS